MRALVSKSAAARRRAAALGAATIVPAALLAHAGNVGVQEQGALALRAVLAADDAKSAAAGEAALAMVLSSMAAERSTPAVQERGARALGSLALGENGALPVSKNALDAVLGVLRGFAEDPACQTAGLRALRNFTYLNDDNKRAVLAADGMECAFSAAKQFGQNCEDAVIEEAFMVLANLGTLDDGRTAANAHGAIGVLVHLAILALLHGLAGVGFGAAQWVATFGAMTLNFLLNNRITYRDRRLRGPTLLRGLILFYLVCGLGAAANIGIANLLLRDGVLAWGLAGAAGFDLAMGGVSVGEQGFRGRCLCMNRRDSRWNACGDHHRFIACGKLGFEIGDEEIGGGEFGQ
jgi:dolichol-phosphate mannosyltransferase